MSKLMSTLNLKKLVVLLCGGALLTWIASHWMLSEKSAHPPGLISMQQPSDASTRAGQIASDASGTSQVQSQATQLKPLNETEVAQLYRWARERGGTGDGRMNPDGTVSGANAFTGYESADNAALSALSKQGDARAAAILGERLANQFMASRGLDDFKQAKDLLLDATMRGFTTSLGKLIEMQAWVAEGSGLQSRVDRPRVDRDALIQTYAYLHLLEKRGDLSTEAYQIQVRHIGELSTQESAQARQAADQIYATLSQQRQKLGLPPFQDGIPPEIQSLIERAAATPTSDMKP